MPEYIELNSSNTIVNIIVADEDYINSQNENTYILKTDIPEERHNKILVGYVFDSANTRFVPRKHFNSWIFDEFNYRWKSPVDMPIDGKEYIWKEDTISWEELTDSNIN
jgi:hypothetical protein